ncbi:hypothetical protein CLOM621_06733 [Clostridium sp. M62/1]|nr:hypothetical protein CLOM621_06733 [Clostridium sp. M62/1]
MAARLSENKGLKRTDRQEQTDGLMQQKNRTGQGRRSRAAAGTWTAEVIQ